MPCFGRVSSSCQSKKEVPCPKETRRRKPSTYLVDDEYLVTALVPSDTACLASSPGRIRRTEVWISREEMVDFLLYAASLDASVATRSKMSKRYALAEQMGEIRVKMNKFDGLPLTNEFRMDMARLEIPVSGWTCFRTRIQS